MSSSVRRVVITMLYDGEHVHDGDHGTHAILPWDEYKAMREEIERLGPLKKAAFGYFEYRATEVGLKPLCYAASDYARRALEGGEG